MAGAARLGGDFEPVALGQPHSDDADFAGLAAVNDDIAPTRRRCAIGTISMLHAQARAGPSESSSACRSPAGRVAASSQTVAPSVQGEIQDASRRAVRGRRQDHAAIDVHRPMREIASPACAARSRRLEGVDGQAGESATRPTRSAGRQRGLRARGYAAKC